MTLKSLIKTLSPYTHLIIDHDIAVFAPGCDIPLPYEELQVVAGSLLVPKDCRTDLFYIKTDIFPCKVLSVSIEDSHTLHVRITCKNVIKKGRKRWQKGE